jgi:hypothetical protein
MLPHHTPKHRFTTSLHLPVFLTSILLSKRTCRTRPPSLLRPLDCIPPARLDIDREPDHQARRETHREQKRKPFPVVACVVDDRLDHVRADHRRRTVGETEETEEHVVEPGRGQLGHHRLGECIVRSLE